MNKYRLLNPSPVLTELSEAVENSFLPFEDETCVDYWKSVLNKLTENQYSEYITWSNIERYETIHYLEAIFLLLNLPTGFLIKNKGFDLFRPATDGCLDEPIRQIFSTSTECVALERSHQVIPCTPFGDEMIGYYQVSEFIEWAIGAGFIEKIEDSAPDDLDKNPLSRYNDYRGWAKVHNTVATLVELELYKGKLTSNSSILNNSSFYGKLSEKLVPKEQNGTDKPKPKTLENYISEYNSFNK